MFDVGKSDMLTCELETRFAWHNGRAATVTRQVEIAGTILLIAIVAFVVHFPQFVLGIEFGWIVLGNGVGNTQWIFGRIFRLHEKRTLTYGWLFGIGTYWRWRLTCYDIISMNVTFAKMIKWIAWMPHPLVVRITRDKDAVFFYCRGKSSPKTTYAIKTGDGYSSLDASHRSTLFSVPVQRWHSAARCKKNLHRLPNKWNKITRA